jgi:hypothetical protein
MGFLWTCFWGILDGKIMGKSWKIPILMEIWMEKDGEKSNKNGDASGKR